MWLILGASGGTSRSPGWLVFPCFSGGALPKPPSISRFRCERCGGPVESDNGWLGQRVEYGPRAFNGGRAVSIRRYALCWRCASPDKEVENAL